MRVRVYKVYIKHVWYYVDAPNKRVAKWCGSNIYNNEFIDFATPKEVRVERFKIKGGERYENRKHRVY